MDTTFSATAGKVIAHYPFAVRSISLLSYKGKKAVWSIQTDRGEVIMKKVPFDSTHISFMIHAINFLKERGIHTPGVYRTSTDESYVTVDGENFVVFESVYGTTPEYENEQHLHMILRGMAQFHQASRGIESPNGAFPSFLLTEWEQDLRTRSDRLLHWKRQTTDAKPGTEFERLFLAHVDLFLEQCGTALTMLQQSCFNEWVRETLAVKTLCHQDYAAGNLSIGDDGCLNVYDMDSLTVDLPVRDMRKILNKVMKKQAAWDVPLMITMMRAYQEVNPLTPEQYVVLAADIQFPHLFYGQVAKYYENREEKWTIEKHTERLRDMIATESSKTAVVQAFLSRLNEVVRHES